MTWGRTGTSAGRQAVRENGWCQGTHISATSLSALVALGRARRSSDLISCDFPSLGRSTVEVAEGAGHTWAQGQAWPGSNPAASTERRRWGQPTWVPVKHLGALPGSSGKRQEWQRTEQQGPGWTRVKRHQGKGCAGTQDLPCKSPATTCAVLVTSSQK